MKSHIWRVKKEYFHQLKSGRKTVEVRVRYPSIKKITEGDTIVFEGYGNNCFCVTRISVYDNFSEMLENENPDSILPGASSEDVLQILRKIYPRQKEKMGVCAIELHPVNADDCTVEVVKASDLLKKNENEKFARMIAQSYIITDWISKDYPDHCDHYFSKYVPGVFSGEREIIACYIRGEIVAMAALKKTNEERKISTLFVKENARGNKIASRLLEKSFQWLGTTTPVATIADYKLDQFSAIIKKYNWKQTGKLEKGFYNDHSQEIIFNDFRAL